MNLRSLRNSKGLTLKQVAEGICCSTQSYWYYETSKRKIPYEKIILLGKFYGMSLDELSLYLVNNQNG
ncbi:MAG: helix-turn-helix transcriptional regulator [Clostridium sp.]